MNGDFVGCELVGNAKGVSVVGTAVGTADGPLLAGASVGMVFGTEEAGVLVGTELAGEVDGAVVGAELAGDDDGTLVASAAEGAAVGTEDAGGLVGATLMGDAEGWDKVGNAVGFVVAMLPVDAVDGDTAVAMVTVLIVGAIGLVLPPPHPQQAARALTPPPLAYSSKSPQSESQPAPFWPSDVQ